MDATPIGAPLTTPEGFVALYRRESELVLRFCARRVLDAETAVDLCAETFAQAFRSRRGFRGTTEVEARAWLLTIARRQIARYLKKGELDRRARDAVGLRTPRLLEGERRGDRGARRARAAATGADRGAPTARGRPARGAAPAGGGGAVVRGGRCWLGVTEATARARVSRGLRALGAALELRSLPEGE